MSKKNVLAINPWIYDVAAYDYWSKPLGLLYISAILMSNGHQVEFIDCMAPYSEWIEYADPDCGDCPPERNLNGHGKYYKELLPTPDIFRPLKRRFSRYGMDLRVFNKLLRGMGQPDIVLVTSLMTYWYPGVFEAIKLIKDVFPGVPTLLGGIYGTLCPEHAQLSGADYIIKGPGEYALVETWQKIFKEPLFFNPDPEDLDSYPYPALDLLTHIDQVPILTSRGCPYQCTYCASHLLCGGFRRRSPSNVADEISHWHHHRGVKNFSFYDDALLVRPEDMIIPLLEEIIHRKHPIQFHCPNGLHLREMTPEIARLMYRSGFKTLRFGFETSDIKRQRETGGKVSNSHLEAAVSHLKQAGYSGRDIGVYILCGLPGQVAEEVKNTVHYVKACGARPLITEYSPIPGTALWSSALDSSPYPIDKEPLCHNNSLLPCRNALLTYEDYREIRKIARY